LGSSSHLLKSVMSVGIITKTLHLQTVNGNVLIVVHPMTEMSMLQLTLRSLP
jgi:hypothetical protein